MKAAIAALNAQAEADAAPIADARASHRSKLASDLEKAKADAERHARERDLARERAQAEEARREADAIASPGAAPGVIAKALEAANAASRRVADLAAAWDERRATP